MAVLYMPHSQSVIHRCTQSKLVLLRSSALLAGTIHQPPFIPQRLLSRSPTDNVPAIEFRQPALRPTAMAGGAGDQVSQEEVIQQLQAVSQGRNGGMTADAAEAGGRKNLMHEAIAKLAVQNLEEAAAKYDLEEELFAEIDFVQVNAFTTTAFGGNPAAVCYLPLERDATWMQLVAKEFNLSETAFLVKRRKSAASKSEGSPKKSSTGFGDLIEKSGNGTTLRASTKLVPASGGGNEFDLRWFTPNGEVRLCGHATLASAHMIFAARLVEQDFVLFHTKSGVLRARQVAESDSMLREPSAKPAATPEQPGGAPPTKPWGKPSGRGTYELDFPIELVSESGEEERGQVQAALGGVEVGFVGRSSLQDVVVEFPSEESVSSFHPTSSLLSSLDCRGIIITATAHPDAGVDFVSRFFAPRFGINEDPVTGSAHCSLGPYWEEKLGKKEMRAHQASERGGDLAVRVDREAGRVYIQGSAVMVMAGTLLNTVRTKAR